MPRSDNTDSITLGHMRSHGIRSALVYCNKCPHRETLNLDQWPDETLLRPLGNKMVCRQCGALGAEVRPDWSEIPARPSLYGIEHRPQQQQITLEEQQRIAAEARRIAKAIGNVRE